MSKREVVILSGVRTAIGDYGGALKDIAPVDLAAKVVREAVDRASIDPDEVGHVVFGNVIHSEPRESRDAISSIPPSSSARDRVNHKVRSPAPSPAHSVTLSGRSPRVSRNPGGAPTRPTTAFSLIPSFCHSGLPA